MPMPDAATAAARWVQNTSSSTQRYTDGVKAVQQAPGALAARQADLWARNVAAARNKFAANSARVTLAQWQEATVNKGAPRLASGVQAAQDNYTQALSKLLPYIASTVGALPARGDLESNITRMTTFVRQMSKYSK